MDTAQSRRVGTRQRLLEAARETFARKGYHDATIAEICERADANIAAVNYHFNSKENLYVEAWRHAFDAALRAYPPTGGLSADAGPEQRLRARIRSFLLRAVDDRHVGDAGILCHELGSPTGLLDQALRETIRPLRRQMHEIVRALAGDDVDEHRIRLCAMSIMNQCFMLMLRTRMHKDAPGPKLLSEHVDYIADHITTFSVGGIGAIRAAAERGELLEPPGAPLGPPCPDDEEGGRTP